MAKGSKADAAKHSVPDEAYDSLNNGTYEERINAWLKLTTNNDGHLKAGDWMQSLLPHITLHSLSAAQPHPSVTFSFSPQPAHCNRLQNLHGGCVASLFDFLTTMCLVLVNRPGGYWQYLGVTRTLGVTYLRPVPAGEDVLVECEIVHVGKRMATLKGTMRRKRDGAVMSTCEHGKVNIDPDANL